MLKKKFIISKKPGQDPSMKSQFLYSLQFIFFLSCATKAEPLFGTAESRIESTDKNYRSYIALIVNQNSENDAGHHLCTGTLVARKQILTSASCVEKIPNIKSLQVIFGSAYTTQDARHRALKYKISSKLTYVDWCKNRPNCIYDQRIDDVCILTLDSVAYGISHAKITGITSNNIISFPDAGQSIKVYAWGHTKDTFQPRLPSKGFIKALSKQDCEERVRKLIPACLSDVVLPERVFCAAADPPILAVDGDFGGPAFYQKQKSVSAILIQRCPSYHPYHVGKEQVNLLLHLAHYREFFIDVFDRI
ncbi:hypothetical protein QAD02_011394 [Eretmocerus hayati]|uniref:Uncharacterized protein n=1 Tax=Eretmocerus hayati TaxID=131215 RepID=A0ACC2NWM0_9HYME|nr:hypothetical protein QAD02_011394 [Eretmocerus hayati]